MNQVGALALTLAVELAVALGWVRACSWAQGKALWGRLPLAVCAASLLTHPLAWRASTVWLAAWSPWPRAVIIELAVVAAETALLHWLQPLSWRRALTVAALMNTLSFAVGVALWWLL